MISKHLYPLLAAIFVSGLTPELDAAGFEVGENTARSIARGGTGAVNRSDPSAVSLNPALLPRVRDHQLMLSSNFFSLDLEFQRNDLVYERGGNEERRTFAPVYHQGGAFPAPYLAASFDVGPENLVLGFGIFGPPAHGRPCFGEESPSECRPAFDEEGLFSSRGMQGRPDTTSGARGMITETRLLVVYFTGGAGYQFELPDDRRLSLGLTAGAAYMQTAFGVFVEANPSVAPPWEESLNQEAFVYAQELTDVRPTGTLGIAYEDGPLRLGASYRPPIAWDARGRVEVDFPILLQAFDPALTSEEVSLQTNQAGKLRLGFGMVGGTHPANDGRPRWDFEVNALWENWSIVDFFRIELEGDIELRGFEEDLETGEYPQEPLFPIYQAKGFQDAFSLRTGFSYGISPLLTAHLGGFLETAAQAKAYTAVDFQSWERYAGSLGATIHLPAGLLLDLGYTYIHMPDREVRTGTGKVYNPIPMSRCQGPDFESSSCQTPGTPPGNPQNEGQWSAGFQILSASMVWTY